MVKRVLIVGLGSIGTRHLRLARELLPDADIGVLRHEGTGVRPENADHCFLDIEHALRFSPQMAVIANPATFHLASAMPLANAGTHLLIEKPISASVEGVPDLIELCREKQVVLATGYNLRYLPTLQEFRSLLRKGTIGKVFSVRSEVGQYLPTWRPGTNYRFGVSARKSLGGGALLELSHEIDYLQWIFGNIKWVQATSSKQSELDIDVEDLAHLVFGFCDERTQGELICSLNMDFFRHDQTRTCTAIGNQGTLRWNGIDGTIELWAEKSKSWRRMLTDLPGRDETYLSEWKDFIDNLNRGTGSLVSGEDGLSVLRVVEAARIAAHADRRVPIDYENDSSGVM